MRNNGSNRVWIRALFSALIVSSVSPFNFGKWAPLPPGVEVPVERLLNNVGAYIRQHPQDAQGYYALGRLHSLAYAEQTSTGIRNSASQQKPPFLIQELPEFVGDKSILVVHREQGPLSDKARNHLLESVRSYRRAVELAPNDAKSFLGLGWMLAISAKRVSQSEAPPGADNSEVGPDAWRASALDAYRKAYALTINSDPGLQGPGPWDRSPISLESGAGIIEILGSRRRTAKENRELKSVKAYIAKRKQKPRLITPIIFSLDRNVSLDDLLASDKVVRFDLAGDGKPGWWPWVKPDTGILVWDPKRTGIVESGLQLFGSVTWWIAWEHGYQPLAALDNDRDGWLSGDELNGLSVWRDKNTNGISEPGEVTPARALGVSAIAASASAKQNSVFYNTQGIRLNNGATLPTYDWAPTEAQAPTLARAKRAIKRQ